MSRLGRLLDRLSFSPRALLSLSDDERATLMTWGMLLGIAAVTLCNAGLVWILNGRWSAALAPQLAEGLFRLSYGLLALQGLLVFGVVAIALRGHLKFSVSPDGVTGEANTAPDAKSAPLEREA